MTREEAIRIIRETYHTDEEMNALESLIPELRESEDEKVRRELIEYLKGDLDDITTDDTDRWIAYLEKQKESLHISESCKENAEYFTAQCGDNRFELIDKAKRDIIAETNIESSPDEMKVLDSFLFRAWQMGWLGKYDVIVPEQKPAEWSEEDEAMLDSVIRIITQIDDLAHEPTFAGPKWTHTYTKELNFLEKLRNRF